MKQYLLVEDVYSDYKEIMSYAEIKGLLAKEVAEDTLRCLDDYEKDIIRENVKLLGKLASGDINLIEIKKELECYNYKIIDLLDTQRDLEDIKEYFKGEGSAVFDNVIDMINKGVNNNG